jgi:hypothetical protein
MLLRPEEPAAGPWRVERVVSTVERLAQEFAAHGERPLLLGVDGRSSSGKTSLAHMIEHAVAASTTVHTDDVAWHHSIFGSDDLLIDGVLAPLHRGQAVHCRPPAWNERDRPGAITVPADRVLVVIEGVGVGRRELTHMLDRLIWVQADQAEIARREAARVAAGEVTRAVQEVWLREEVPFLAHHQPWTRADLIVAGTPERPHDPTSEIIVSPPTQRDPT